MQNSHLEFDKSTGKSGTSAMAPKICDYMDYRLFLTDWYQHRRKLSSGDLRPYSYQMFSAAANIKSPNYLKMIIEGRRNLSDDMIGKFAKALNINKEQTDEFRLMVQFNQAADSVDRNVFLKDLSALRDERKLRSGEIDRKTWEKIPNWVAWVVYAMVDQEGVSFDIPTLKRLLRGKANEHEIDEALKSLINGGDLTKDEATGMLTKTRHLIESPEDVPVSLIRKLQTQLMLLGLESLHQDSATEREFGTLTLSMTHSEFEDVKFKLRQLRKSINKENGNARSRGKGERVYQLNIQLFPVTNRAEGVMEKPVLGKLDLKELLKSSAPMGTGSSVDSLLNEARLAAQSFSEERKPDPS